jgi:hypothetical protein
MSGFVEGIYLPPDRGASIKHTEVFAALEGCDLRDDRYCVRTGHWSRFGRVCEDTFIATEHLDAIERETGLGVKTQIIKRFLDYWGVRVLDVQNHFLFPAAG